MRILLNTLYVTTPEAYLSKDGVKCCGICEAKRDIPYSYP